MVEKGEVAEFTFGVVADIQYADKEDGYNYHQTIKRFYRSSLDMLRAGVSMWNTSVTPKPSFILQLGDAIDGWNKRLNISESSLHKLLEQFSAFDNPVYHVWGNHDYYNFPREYLLKTRLYSGNEKFSFPVENKTYYRSQPHPKLRILALDSYDVSLLGSAKDSAEYQIASKYMENNPNTDLNAPEGLEGVNRRFVKFNGGVGEEQLSWIQENLQEARENKENVIVIGHCPVYEAATTDPICLTWNYTEVLQLLQTFSDCVLAYFAGHDHDGAQATDSSGILHLTFPGVLENNQECDCATVFAYKKQLKLVGNGRVSDHNINLKFPL